MMTLVSRNALIGGWCAMVAVLLAFSVVMGASVSTSALLLALGLAGPVIIVLIGGGAPSQTVAEMIRSTDTKSDR